MKRGFCLPRPSLWACVVSASSISPAAASPFGTKPERSPSSTTARSTISRRFATSSNPKATAFARAPIPKSSSTPTRNGASARVERLHGMFAFAIVEMPQGRGGRASRVFLARDRLGIKPLYYAVVDGALFSPPRYAPCSPAAVSRRIFRSEAVPAYLLFGSVCEPTTLVEGVFSLPPGHTIGIATDEPIRSLEPKPYWDPRHGAASQRGSARTIRRRLRNTFARCSRTRLRPSHRRRSRRRLPQQRPRFDGHRRAREPRQKRHSHLHGRVSRSGIQRGGNAARTAKRLGTDHCELTLSDQEMVARLDEAIAAFDQPSMDGINTYFVSWAARQAGLKVALSGLGSDELFGGYSSFRATAAVARVARLARFCPRPVRALPSAHLARSASRSGLARRRSQSMRGISRSEPAAASLFFHAPALHAANRRVSHSTRGLRSMGRSARGGGGFPAPPLRRARWTPSPLFPGSSCAPICSTRFCATPTR